MGVAWDDSAWEDYLWWRANDRKVLKRINLLLRDIHRSGHDGIGRPEPLRFQLSGYWSRRITSEHRLVYRVDEAGNIHVIACRHHYGE